VPVPRHPGAPVKINTEVRDFINSETLGNAVLGTKRLAKMILSRFNVAISHESVRQTRVNLKFMFKRLRKRPLLNELQISARVQFCREQLGGAIDWGRNVVISDESRFCLYSDNLHGLVKRGSYNESAFLQTPKFQ
jgi:hypothetical protein